MYNEQNAYMQDDDAVQTMKKFLGLEHFAWKFGAIMTLICTILLVFASVIMIIVGASTTAAAQDQFNGVAPMLIFSVLGIVYLIVSAVVLVPVTVICFTMIKKVEYYQSTLNTDISIARKRCTSVGMIVFCVLFNTLAAIFFIINFVKTKNNAAAFDRIEAGQKN